MNTEFTWPDRAVAHLLKIAGIINLAAFLLFLLLFVFAAGQAKAQDAQCPGRDLIAAMKVNNPGEYSKLRAEADKVPNGNSILYRVEHAGVKPSYVMGTMHMSDPRVLDMPDAAKSAYDNASTVVIESTDVLDKKKMAAFMLGHPEYTMLPDGKTLKDVLSPADYKIVADGLKKRGVMIATVSHMRPWIISSMVALPACELARRGDGVQMLDIGLAIKAKSQGKNVEGLETLTDQIGAMASLPLELNLKGLVETLKLGDKLPDVMETMISLYTKGDLGMLWPFLRLISPDTDDKGYSEFEKTMVTTRNHTMADHAAPFLEKGNAFIAVGALHLPGEEGLIALLQKAGYTVTPVN
jgi:uncharacterized protein YbaP (TraB family)